MPVVTLVSKGRRGSRIRLPSPFRPLRREYPAEGGAAAVEFNSAVARGAPFRNRGLWLPDVPEPVHALLHAAECPHGQRRDIRDRFIVFAGLLLQRRSSWQR